MHILWCLGTKFTWNLKGALCPLVVISVIVQRRMDECRVSYKANLSVIEIKRIAQDPHQQWTVSLCWSKDWMINSMPYSYMAGVVQHTHALNTMLIYLACLYSIEAWNHVFTQLCFVHVMSHGYPNGLEASREAGWGSEFVSLKKNVKLTVLPCHTKNHEPRLFWNAHAFKTISLLWKRYHSIHRSSPYSEKNQQSTRNTSYVWPLSCALV